MIKIIMHYHRTHIINLVRALTVFMVLFLLSACSDNTTGPNPKVAQPAFTPPGGVYQEPQIVEIATVTEGAEIRYTTDRSEPTKDSQLYTVPLELEADTILKAKAFKKGWQTSDIRINTYLITGQVTDPVFADEDGTYQAPFNVKLSCETEDALIRFTTDGSEPNSLSAVYTETWTIDESTTIKAAAFKDNWLKSETVTARYEIEPRPYGFIHLITDPLHASVYINGSKKNQLTPTTFSSIPPGENQIRVYKEGFNEYNESLTVYPDSVHTMEVNLEKPSYPLPHFTFHNPASGAHFNNNVVNIAGHIQLVDANHNVSGFSGDTALLNLNGIDRKVPVNSGYFDLDIAVTSGQNTLQMRANSHHGDTGVSEPLIIIGDFDKPDIEINLTWNTLFADLDLHVWNPLGEHCYYGNDTISDGSLDIDANSRYGPETFTAPNALDGTYVIKVNLFSLSHDDYSDATVELAVSGSPPLLFGPRRMKYADKHGKEPKAWWSVTTFTVKDGLLCTTDDPIPPCLQKKIQLDLQELQQNE